MRFTALCGILLLWTGTALAQPSMWQIDSSHTSVQFAVRHLMVSTVRGTFGKVSGVAKLDPSDPAKSSVEATIDVSTIDTRDEKRDAHLKDTDFLDVARFPTISFKSKSVQKVDDTHYKVVGDLTLHGVTKPVTLDVEGSPTPLTDPWGNARLGGVATTKMNRQDFGIAFSKAMDNGGLVVGNEVEITIDVELTKQK